MRGPPSGGPDRRGDDLGRPAERAIGRLPGPGLETTLDGDGLALAQACPRWPSRPAFRDGHVNEYHQAGRGGGMEIWVWLSLPLVAAAAYMLWQVVRAIGEYHKAKKG
jgi:hypothetical protein